MEFAFTSGRTNLAINFGAIFQVLMSGYTPCNKPNINGHLCSANTSHFHPINFRSQISADLLIPWKPFLVLHAMATAYVYTSLSLDLSAKLRQGFHQSPIV